MDVADGAHSRVPKWENARLTTRCLFLVTPLKHSFHERQASTADLIVLQARRIGRHACRVKIGVSQAPSTKVQKLVDTLSSI